jgi:chemotaxis protein MotB
MPSIFDFSAAGPWLISGFLIGLLGYWLFNKFFGSGGRNTEALADLSAQLDGANGRIAAFNKDSETLASKANYYESEFNSLLATNTALNQDLVKLKNTASRGTGEVSHLSTDLAAARTELEKLRAQSAAAGGDASRVSGELASTKAELEKLRAEFSAAAATAEKSYRDKISSLQSQLAASGNASSDTSRLSADLASAKAELEKLRADSAAAVANAEKTYQDQISALKSQLATAQSASGDATGLKGEVTRLSTELENFKSGAQKDFDALVAESDGYRAEAEKLAKALAAAQQSHQTLAMEHHAAKNDLHQVRAGLEETSLMVAQRHSEIEQLKAKLANVGDVETYKRFKDALDAANRIAAGLPDKS